MEPNAFGLSKSEVALLRAQLEQAEALQEQRLRQALDELDSRSRQCNNDAAQTAGSKAVATSATQVGGQPLVVLTEDHEAVLKTLARTPYRCMQIAQLAAVGPIRNRETVGTLLKEMARFGLVHRPFGRRRGYALTGPGMDRARLLAA